MANTRVRKQKGNTRGSQLNMLCRNWVHSIITNETWTVAPWIIEVIINQTSFYDFEDNHEDWIARFCLELECTVDLAVEVANII